MKFITKTLFASSAFVCFSIAAAQAANITSVANGVLSADGTWGGGIAPLSGTDSVVIAHNINITSEFTIASGETMTATAGTLRIGGGGHLTVATGGSLDLGNFNLAESSAGGQLTIEAGATAKVKRMWNDETAPSYINEWIADASGVTTLEVTDRFTLRGTNSVLQIDLSNYDISNGTTLVLVDYENLSVQEQAVGDNGWNSIVLTDGWSADLDLAYDIDGNGDLGIALTNIVNVSGLSITGFVYAPDADPTPTVTLTWSKTGAEFYIAKVSTDMTDWDADLLDNLTAAQDENPADSAHITMTFPLPSTVVGENKLFFRIEEEPVE